ncbi:NAD(P)/FAD-dependent oxidoreductase [Pelosinus fermentans]|uniref:Monooxygenase FAD-binding protein n=1 Tax=Pelosinus fermentans JBW45 TaxID=1192197 RepID=I8TMM2_9FIRM|nr:NAD(P)/FAD-dependent oxidoreductase [Pelosinus fermentans]AJQ25611.1 monooxygenase FAD-binding protein [Pelosinus fermentans JBW45]
MYDVIVIGAGPAGCMAAKRLARTGYKVLLVEKMQVPREKSCSGILIERSIDLVESEFGKIPDTVLCSPSITKGIIIYNEENLSFKFESKGLNIWRSAFDHWLTLQVIDNGVEFRPSTLALSCEEKEKYVAVHLKGDTKYYENAKAVIVCDGAGSVIKKSLLNVLSRNIITYQTFCKGTIDLDDKFFHAFLHSQFSEHDAWVNVKDDFLIFGVCVKDVNKIESYYAQFLSFLISTYNAKIQSCSKKERWIIPEVETDCPLDLGRGRVLFAGESANFLNPMGEGVSSALVSGCAASEAIKQIYVQGKDIDGQALLSVYEKNILQEKERMIRQWDLLAGISPKFSHYNQMHL